MKTSKNKTAVKKKQEVKPDPENENQEIFNEDVEELKEGSDSIEIEIEEGERITYGSSFSPQDGDLGDESEDISDLPDELRKVGHRYDPTLSTGGAFQDELDELELGIDIVDADDAGLGYGENDYTKDTEEE